MSVLDTQIALSKERLSELRSRKKIQKIKPAKYRNPKHVKALILRVQGLSFRTIGERIGHSGTSASKMIQSLLRKYRQRKCAPVFHELFGNGWEAKNCHDDHSYYRYWPREAHVRQYHLSIEQHLWPITSPPRTIERLPL